MNAELVGLILGKMLQEESRSQLASPILLAADLMHQIGVASDVGNVF
jgi:hypothetical protein